MFKVSLRLMNLIRLLNLYRRISIALFFLFFFFNFSIIPCSKWANLMRLNISDASIRFDGHLLCGTQWFLSLLCYIYQLKNQCSPSHCSAGNGKLRVHDVDSGSPTTEQNLENVFQLIHRINFIFGNTHDAHTDDDIQH